jgi:cobalamin biosynthesis protein CobT
MALSKRTAAALEGPFTKLARTFARNHNITVQLSGTGCFTTNRGVINLPANADHLSDEDQEILHGMLDHEVEHQQQETRSKEDPSFPSPMKVMATCKDKRERSMFNVYEDIRIESEAARRYIGVAQNLEALHKHLVGELAKTVAKGKYDGWWLLGCGIIGRAHGWDTSFLPMPFQTLLGKLEDLIIASRSVKTPHETLQLARETIDRVKAAAEAEGDGGDGDMEDSGDAPEKAEKHKKEGGKTKEKSSKSEAEDGDTDDSGEGESGDEGDEEGEGGGGGKGEDGEEGGEGEGSGDEDKDGEGGEAGDEGGEGGGEEKGKDAKAGTKPSGRTPESVGDETREEAQKMMAKDAVGDDLMETIRKVINDDAVDDIRKHRRYVAHPSAMARDRVVVSAAGTKEDYESLLNSVRPQVSALRAKILAVLQSQKVRRHVGDKERGGIDSGTLATLRTGNKRIFAERTPDVDTDTAVGILIDQSGSMGGVKAATAAKAAIALSECLSKVGIPFAVWGFDNPGGSVGYGDGLYSRVEACETVVYKDFHEQFQAVRTRMVNVFGRGNNTDGEFVLSSARILARRSESRKILMVLSDGEPAAGGSGDDAHLKDAVRRTIAAGIEVFGIGILTDAPRRFYPDWAHVDKLDSLAVVVFQMLRKYLLDRKTFRR